MLFEFHANFVDADALCSRLSFEDHNDDSGEHYFVIDRSEESPNDALPDMDNVYIERDDQGWGGYGGIDRVVLMRDSLTLLLDERMAERMGNHEIIRVGFQVSDAVFNQLCNVLRQIMRGYELRMEIDAV